MKLKRSKQYRKLLQQYSMAFGFREPYQVLVDSQLIQDSERFKMSLVRSLENTLGARVKPLITQCSIRHLYTLQDISRPTKDSLIATAKSMERRRCNHHVLDDPLTTLECFQDVIDPKRSLTNPHRYIVASQAEEVRKYCRGVQGVPLVYVKRSVMIMEPMSEGTANTKEQLDRSKFRSGLRRSAAAVTGKRKREDQETSARENLQLETDMAGDPEIVPKKTRNRGPKGPNPLSIKKSKKVSTDLEQTKHDASQHTAKVPSHTGEMVTNVYNGFDAVDAPDTMANDLQSRSSKRKRKRKIAAVEVI